MTNEEIVAKRVELEAKISEGEKAEKELRMLQAKCRHPETENSTTTDMGWAKDLCGICHRTHTYPVTEEARARACD